MRYRRPRFRHPHFIGPQPSEQREVESHILQIDAMSRPEPRYDVSLCIYRVQHADLVTFLSRIILPDTQIVDPDESGAIPEAQVTKYVVRILWNLNDVAAASYLLDGCLVSTDVGSSSKERLTSRCKVVKTRLISFAEYARPFSNTEAFTC